MSSNPSEGYYLESWSTEKGPISGSILTIPAGTYGDFTVTGTFAVPYTAQTITLSNPNSALVFRSISGNLYTDSACTTLASTNTKYEGTIFYYKSTETKPTGSYILNYGDGSANDEDYSTGESDVNTFYREGSLTACLGTSGYCWSDTWYTYENDDGDIVVTSDYYRLKLSDGSWDHYDGSKNYHRISQSKSF